uniref:ORF85 n=1 Tax=Bacillus thuringiensis serovar kurstaki str. YBT-1520 TaxID=570416 RepID=B8PS75_BACTK|nr:ORF85 [Bacillus thuringiensis serovar kurstaki str. YBT-1520]
MFFQLFHTNISHRLWILRFLVVLLVYGCYLIATLRFFLKLFFDCRLRKCIYICIALSNMVVFQRIGLHKSKCFLLLFLILYMPKK